MKKLFSAATSLIMAASAVASTVVPFATGAADASKSFELRAFEGASTKISADAINAGDVTVPVGVYYVESTADLKALNFQLTVNGATSGADASGVKFEMIQAGGKVNATPKEYKTVDGTFTTDILINFASKVEFDDFVEETVASAGGQVGSSVAENNADAGAKNAYAGYAWTPPTGGYKWAGTTSDEYPVVVLNVTFPKGTPQGTYSLEFLDYAYDKAHPDNLSCMVESGSTKYTTKNSNLTLKNIDIVIGDAGEVKETTTTQAPTVVTTTTTQAPTVVTTTTTTGGGSVTPTPSTDPTPAHAEESEFTPVDDFIIDLNNGGAGYTFTLDELKEKNTFNISATVKDMGSHKSAKLIAKPGKAPDGFTITPRTTNYAYNNAVWELNGETYYCNTMNADGDSDVIGSDKPIMAFQAAVDVDTVKPGVYTYTFARFDVAEDGTGQKEISPLVIPAVITIVGDETPVETTTTVTTGAPVQTTTTTTATPSQGTTVPPTDAPVGDVLYGDANDNKVVNIADVVVLNKWLNNNADYAITAQGKVNADCCDPKDGAEINASDSDAIIRSIVHRITLPTTGDALKADQAKD